MDSNGNAGGLARVRDGRGTWTSEGAWQNLAGSRDQSSKAPRLRMVLSTHVDDLKGTAKRKVAESLLSYMESKLGSCTVAWQCFVHTGIQHSMSADGVYCHQEDYAKQLQMADVSSIKGVDEGTPLTAELSAVYLSLLGGIAWMCLTRADIAVYVQALQRRSQAPRAKDLKRLNLVVRFTKRKRVGIFYRRVAWPLRLTDFSDAAFKALPEDSSGLALRGSATLLCTDGAATPVSCDGRAHLLDWTCAKHKRVMRSTFAAELNALIDSGDRATLIQLALYQFWYGGFDETAVVLAHKLEGGR